MTTITSTAGLTYPAYLGIETADGVPVCALGHIASDRELLAALWATPAGRGWYLCGRDGASMRVRVRV